MQQDFIILTAIEYPQNGNAPIIHVKCDDRPLPVMGDTQARAYVVAQGTTVWEGPKALAVVHDALGVLFRYIR